jgi:4-amino-4-deoxychorismate lyase
MSEDHSSTLPNSTTVYRLFERQNQHFQTNRGLLFGDGFFESIIQINGHYPLLEYHIKRIKWSADLLKIDISLALDLVETELNKLKSKGIFKIKVIICRSGHGNYTPFDIASNSPTLLFDKQVLEIDHSEEKLLKIEISNTVKLISGLDFTKIKSLSALPYVLAGIECRENNLDDLVLLNDKNEIAECISSNIFLLKNNKWITPPLSSGCVAGVMREYIIENSNMFGINIEVNPLKKSDLTDCEGVLISNAIRGARVVAQIEDNIIPTTKSAILAKKINLIFS